MATQNLQNISPLGLQAGASISANKPVKGGSADNTVIETAADTDITVGVSLVSASADEPVAVQDKGVAKLQCGGTVTRFTRLMWATGGKVVTATTGKPIIGFALESGVNGDFIKVQLTLPSLTLAP